MNLSVTLTSIAALAAAFEPTRPFATQAPAQDPKKAPSATFVPEDGDPIVVVRYAQGVKFAYPRWSKDGARILYQSNETGKWQIYAMNADGSKEERITKDEFNDDFPDWSPSNRKIAFVSDREGNEDVYVMNVDGTELVNLTRDSARDIHPYWTPDEKSVLFNSNRKGASSPPNGPSPLQVYRIDIDGTGLTRLTETTDEETCARFSPDMKNIVLLRGLDGLNDEVFMLSPDGASQTNLTKSDAAEGWPVWMPDAKHILFSSTRTGPFRLFWMKPDGTEVAQISHVKAPWMDARASISRDGKQLAFNRESGETIALVTMPMPDPNFVPKPKPAPKPPPAPPPKKKKKN